MSTATLLELDASELDDSFDVDVQVATIEAINPMEQSLTCTVHFTTATCACPHC